MPPPPTTTITDKDIRMQQINSINSLIVYPNNVSIAYRLGTLPKDGH